MFFWVENKSAAQLQEVNIQVLTLLETEHCTHDIIFCLSFCTGKMEYVTWRLLSTTAAIAIQYKINTSGHLFYYWGNVDNAPLIRGWLATIFYSFFFIIHPNVVFIKSPTDFLSKNVCFLCYLMLCIESVYCNYYLNNFFYVKKVHSKVDCCHSCSNVSLLKVIKYCVCRQ